MVLEMFEIISIGQVSFNEVQGKIVDGDICWGILIGHVVKPRHYLILRVPANIHDFGLVQKVFWKMVER